jgi:alginate O-acetyltransferase complex protein AlgI
MGRIMDGLDDATVRARVLARGAALAGSPIAAVIAIAGTFSPFLYFQF